MRAIINAIAACLIGAAVATGFIVADAFAASVTCNVTADKPPVDYSLGGYFKRDQDWSRTCSRS